MNNINPIKRLAALLADARRSNLDSPNKRVIPRADPKPKTKKKIKSKNKGVGQSKKRRKMAAKSNQINRKRVKGWKH